MLNNGLITAIAGYIAPQNLANRPSSPKKTPPIRRGLKSCGAIDCTGLREEAGQAEYLPGAWELAEQPDAPLGKPATIAILNRDGEQHD